MMGNMGRPPGAKKPLPSPPPPIVSSNKHYVTSMVIHDYESVNAQLSALGKSADKAAAAAEAFELGLTHGALLLGQERAIEVKKEKPEPKRRKVIFEDP